MNYKQVLLNAESECGYLKDEACIKIYFASSEDSIAEGFFNRIQSEIIKNNISAKLFRAGSFGYYGLEPILVIEKKGDPVKLYSLPPLDSIPDFVREVIVEGMHGSATIFQSISGIPLFQLENRIALRNCGILDPDNINHYIIKGKGYSGLAKALEIGQSGVIEELRRSGFRGMGEAGYETADKWEICRDADGDRKVMICNAVDSDPDSLTSRLLLGSDPHSVLEGMLIGAYAIGASICYICINESYDFIIEKISKALEQMRQYTLAGDNILDTSFSCNIGIKKVSESLVSGEETAIIRCIEEKQPMPFIRPHYPAENRISEMPTMINNSETISNVSAIFQQGSEWFSGIGLGKDKGTKVVNLSGDVINKYTVEVSLGTRIKSIVEEIGGGISDGKKLKAVQFGGPTGRYFNLDFLDMPLDYHTLKEKDTAMGSGTIQVLDSDSCIVERCRDTLSYINDQSCGKCVFCREGTHQMSDILTDISGGESKPDDLKLLQEIGDAMRIGCICSLGRTAPNPVLSSINHFREEFDFHIKEKKCPVIKND